jgi:hypothetical protein
MPDAVDLTPITNPLARKWAEALLSGKYEQGTKCLRNSNNQFCCLGVALDVLKPEGWTQHFINMPDNEEDVVKANTYVDEHDDTYSEVMPSDFWDKINEGLRHDYKLDQSFLAGANDEGETFRYIVVNYILGNWKASNTNAFHEEIEDAY